MASEVVVYRVQIDNPMTQTSLRTSASQTVMACDHYQQLQSEVEKILAELAETTILQLEVFRARRYPEALRLDKELELLVGKKERSIGALREHANEHQCQPKFPDD